MKKNESFNKTSCGADCFKKLDKQQKELGNELYKLLEEKYYKVEIAFVNINYETEDRGLVIYIYENDYDYRKISLKFIVDAEIRDYFYTVLNCVNKYKLHTATAEEVYLHRLIKQYKLVDYYIIDGTLMNEGEEIADLNTIISISKDEGKIVITDDCCRCVINLESGTYCCEELECCIAKINKQTNNTYYFIKNNILYECNLKEKIQLALCGLEDILNFKLLEDSLAINLKDDNTMFLEKDFAVM